MIAIRVVCAVLALVILVAVAERMLPLRAVERDQWEWHYRPQGKFPGVDSVGRRQVALFGGVGLLTGYALAGIPGALVTAVLVVAGRWAVGVRRRPRLPRTLDNGITRAMFSASPMLFDSESAANIYAAGWLRNATVRARPVRGPVLPTLMVRRIRRRSYIPALLLAVSLLGVVAVSVHAAGVRTVVMLSWAVLASAAWRATALGVPDERPWRWAVLGALAVVGVGAQWLMGVPESPVVFSVLTAVAIVSGALHRGRPRTNDDFTIIEDGLSGGVPAGMLSYWLAGWVAAVPAVLAVGVA
ncbi:hypothetical protein AALF15_04030 [Corynebacteriaceae bacterium 7-707]